MTEDEARTKRCPMVGFKSHCIGSECMAWDWFADTYRHKSSGGIHFKPRPDEADQYEKLPACGDCGLKSVELQCNGY